MAMTEATCIHNAIVRCVTIPRDKTMGNRPTQGLCAVCAIALIDTSEHTNVFVRTIKYQQLYYLPTVIPNNIWSLEPTTLNIVAMPIYAPCILYKA